MREESTAVTLKNYLDYAGILACNENPYLKCLSDIGCGWGDVVALIDAHEVFYCKAYRKRTTYLSIELYFLLKEVRAQRQMDDTAAGVYDLLRNQPMDMEMLRMLTRLDRRELNKANQFLLGNLYITAMGTGRELNPNWSTFIYGTAQEWETHVKKPDIGDTPEERLRAILGRSMSEREIDRLLK